MARLTGRRGASVAWGLILASALASVASWAADENLADQVQRIKPSVVAVGTYRPGRSPAFNFRGTGFVVGNGLLVATSGHVLPDKSKVAQSEVLAVAQAEEVGRIRVRSAVRLAEDPTHDLALLRLSGGDSLPALDVDEGSGVREGEAVGFTGFPLGAALGLRPVTHRGVVSAITPIANPAARAQDLSTSQIRRLGSSFEVLQLDATAYPGNSGSPLFDIRTGLVVGIVNMVFVKGVKESALTHPSGITYAIPAKHLRALLEGRH